MKSDGYTTLRVMTEKSKLGFGKYPDLTIGDILTLGHNDYIAWIYYTLPRLSFCQSVMEYCKLIPIDKPGTSEDAHKKWKHQHYIDRYDGMDEEQYMKARFRDKCYIKRCRKAQMIRTEHTLNVTKGRLQAMNQGHIKNL